MRTTSTTIMAVVLLSVWITMTVGGEGLWIVWCQPDDDAD
jgi:hypothetical protein